MTERDWADGTDTSAMMYASCQGESVRKLRLFAVAICRANMARLTDRRSRIAVVTGERYADDRATSLELACAWPGANDVNRHPGDPDRLEVMASICAAGSPYLFDSLRRWVAAEDAPLLREIFGNPFIVWPPTDRYPAWRNATTLSIAEGAYFTNVDRWALDGVDLSVLADACEDAGCTVSLPCPTCKGADYFAEGDRMSAMYPSTCPTCRRHPHSSGGGRVLTAHPLVAHLRSPGPHYRGCWALDLVLGKA